MTKTTYSHYNSRQDIQVHVILFLFPQENICCGYSLEVPQWVTSDKYNNICFHCEIRKILALFCGKSTLSGAMSHDILCLLLGIINTSAETLMNNKRANNHVKNWKCSSLNHKLGQSDLSAKGR